jgi:hypothetical protein
MVTLMKFIYFCAKLRDIFQWYHDVDVIFCLVFNKDQLTSNETNNKIYENKKGKNEKIKYKNAATGFSPLHIAPQYNCRT